jgi:hypothetical protein
MQTNELIKLLFKRIDLLEQKIELAICKGCNLGPDGGTFYNCPIHGSGNWVFNNINNQIKELNEKLKEGTPDEG